MPFFTNDDVKIYYEIEGEGPPVVLIHGFALNIENNWKPTNWVEIFSNFSYSFLDRGLLKFGRTLFSISIIFI